MNKSQMVETLSTKTGMDKANSQKFLEVTLGIIIEELENGGEVKLPNFMNFSTKKRATRVGRNPQTGEKMTIKAKNVVKIVVSKNVKDLIN